MTIMGSVAVGSVVKFLPDIFDHPKTGRVTSVMVNTGTTIVTVSVDGVFYQDVTEFEIRST